MLLRQLAQLHPNLQIIRLTVPIAAAFIRAHNTVVISTLVPPDRLGAVISRIEEEISASSDD